MSRILFAKNMTTILLASSLCLGGCAGIPGLAGFSGKTPPPTTSNSRQKASFDACQTTGSCNMSDVEAKHAVYRSQLDERKSLADYNTRKRNEDVRSDELANDSFESNVRREENRNSVGSMVDTVWGYGAAVSGVKNIFNMFR